MIVTKLKPINIIYNEQKFEIYSKKPLKLNEIKDLIRKKINNLNEFDLKYYSHILNEKDNLESYSSLRELTVATKK